MCKLESIEHDYIRILNRAWLYKDSKVSVLQADAQLAQKG